MDYQRSIVYIVFFTFWVIKTIIEVYDICEKSRIFAAVFYL